MEDTVPDSDPHGQTPFEKAFHGLCGDCMSGIIGPETMETAMDTLFQPDMAVSLGMNACDDGVVEEGWDVPSSDVLDEPESPRARRTGGTPLQGG